MAGQKACKHCKSVVESGNRCPVCGSTELVDNFKGKAVILNPELSEIAKNTKIKSKGTYAMRLG